MLVLTRKQNEKIQIGDNVTITVVRTKGKTVRLGIEAPAHLSVLRGELVFDVQEAEPTDATPATDAPAARREPAVRDAEWSVDGSSGRAPSEAVVAVEASEGWAPLRGLVSGRK